MKKFLISSLLALAALAALPALAVDGGLYTANAWTFQFTNATGSAVGYTGTVPNSYTNIFTANIGPLRQKSICLQLDAAVSVITTNTIGYKWSTDGVSYGAVATTNITCAAGLSTALIPLSTLGAGYFQITGVTNLGAGSIVTNGSTIRIPVNYNAP